jgi:hypothetical protein
MLVMLCWRRGGAGHTDTEGIALQRGTCVAEYPWPLQLALSISEYDLVCLDKLSLPPIVALASNTAPLMVIKVAATDSMISLVRMVGLLLDFPSGNATQL